MAVPVLMPKQGNSVESCVILNWVKKEGETVAQGEVICEAETDKAAIDVEAPAPGILLKTFFKADDDVPVQTVIAVIGQAGEDVSSFAPGGASGAAGKPEAPGVAVPAETAPAVLVPEEPAPAVLAPPEPAAAPVHGAGADPAAGISPRARNLADRAGFDPAAAGMGGTGPGGRIIERDIKAVLDGREPLTPAARELVRTGGFEAPAFGAAGSAKAAGSALGGRIGTEDLVPAGTWRAGAAASGAQDFPGPVNEVPLKGVRKTIAGRMKQSLDLTAQLTNNTAVDTSALLAYRKKLAGVPEAINRRPGDFSMTDISINSLLLYLVSRVLPAHRDLNAHFAGDTIRYFSRVHLGFAVDTPRGLLVPVIRNAGSLSLMEITREARRLAAACREGKIAPDELTGATFTVSNLSSLGIESFTPIINPPEVAILGVCASVLRPVEKGGEIVFRPYMGLSLTYDHQVVDGAPASRFLWDLREAIENFEVYLAG